MANNDKPAVPIQIRNDGSFLEQFKRMQAMQQSGAATVNSLAQSNIKIRNDGSFLEQFQKLQKSSTSPSSSSTSQSKKPESQSSTSILVPQTMTISATYKPVVAKASTKISEVFDVDYDLSLTEEQQEYIEEIAESMVNGDQRAKAALKRAALNNPQLKFLNETTSDGAVYYKRIYKRKLDKKEEDDRAKRQQSGADADQESDEDSNELARFQNRLKRKRTSDQPVSGTTAGRVVQVQGSQPAAQSSKHADELRAFQEKIKQQRSGKRSRWEEPTDLAPVASINEAPMPGSSFDTQLARQVTGGESLTDSQKKQLDYQRQMNVMYEMITNKKKAQQEAERALMMGKPSKGMYAYDSDEDTEGGTWEHKMRVKEMAATREWADELTSMNRGKHHLGDFMPPEELEKFLETYKALREGRQPDISDYKEFKITCDNIGFKMLQNMGWEEGQGLGPQQQGITQPVNKGNVSLDKEGLGESKPHNLDADDDEFEAYRKRMMLAYRFRPNPLNNPRRSYY